MKFYIDAAKIIMMFFLLFISAAEQNVTAQEKPYFVTYGKQSLQTSGDDNYRQAFYIKVNESAPDKFYIRIFDADCVGQIDHLFTVYNTETSFSLYGTDDIYPNETLLKGSVDIIESASGKLLHTKLYSDDFDIDNKWITFAAVDKNSGEYFQGNYYFKLIVESDYGTDGNAFDIFISGDSESNTSIESIEYYSYSPTIRQESLNRFGEVKFYVDGKSSKYSISNFDMDGADLFLETSLRSSVKLSSSGDGNWESNTIDFNKYEINSYAGINFSSLSGKKNDITFFIRDGNNKLVPFPLPIYNKTQNSRPVIVKQINSTEEWNIKIFDASLSKDSDGDALIYFWEFGDGTSGTGIKVNHTYQSSGVYNCALLIKDNSGEIANSSLQNFTVKINQLPVAKIGDDILVSSSEVEFDASASNDPDGNIINYNWNFGDGSTGNGIKTKHTYTNPGTYKVTLQVTDDSQLENDKNSTSIKVTINHKPIADAGPDIITEPGKEIKFNAHNSVDPDGSIVLYNWDFGDGKLSDSAEAVHSFSKPGKYTVRLKVQDNTTHETAVDFDEALITVNAEPIAEAGIDIIAAPNQEIEFNTNKSVDYDGNKLNYVWEFSDGFNKSEKEIVKRSFAEPGLYKAVLTVTDNSGAANNKSSDEITIRINNSPSAKIGSDILTCNPVIGFEASGSSDPDGDLLKYSWDFGDGSPSVNGIKVLHEYKSNGSYPVLLTVDDGTGLSNSTNTNSITVIINQSPIADAGENLVICAGEFVPFDGGKSYDPEKGLLKYFWDFGDSTSAEGINPVKNYYVPGIYNVVLKVEDDSGLDCNYDIDTKLVTVIESPIANAGEDLEVCAFEEVQFDGTKSTDADGVVNSYTWDFGDGTTGGGASPKHTYTKAGTYKVALSITGETQGDCDNSSADEMTVIVNEAPIAEFTLPSAAPINISNKFDASASNGKKDKIIKYEWNFGNGSTSEGKIVNHTYEKSGLYFVTLKVITDSKSACNSSSVVKSILINESPVAAAEADTKAKVNSTIKFSGLKSYDNDGAITDYKWNFGDGNSAEGVMVEHVYDKKGKYKVALEVKDNSNLSNNSAKSEFVVEVYEEAQIDISSIDIACPGQEIKFTAKLSENIPDSLIKYTWEFGDGSTGEGKEVVHSFISPGNYNISLMVKSGLFEDKTKVFSKNVNINNTPVIDVQKNIYPCLGEEVILDASKSIDADNDKLKYTWEIDGSEKSGSKVLHNFNNSGEYKIKLIVEDGSNTNCGISEEEIIVRINSAPVAVAEKNITGFTGGAYDAVLFDASKSYDEDGDGLTYEWDFGDGEKASGSKVFHNYKKAGSYKAVLKVSDGKISKCSNSSQNILVVIKNR